MASGSHCLGGSLWVLDPRAGMLGDKERISTNSYQQRDRPQTQTQALRHRNEPDTTSPQRMLSPKEKCHCTEKYIHGCSWEYKSKDEDSEVAASLSRIQEGFSGEVTHKPDLESE